MIDDSVDPQETPERSAAPEGRPKKRLLTRRNFMHFGVGAGIGVIGGGAYAWQSHRLELVHTRYELRLGSSRAIHVAAISDLHLAGSPEDYALLLQRVREASPDLILVVGDTVDHPRGYELVSILAEIDAPLGKFACLGNWDCSLHVDEEEVARALARAGVRLLVNEGVQVGGINLVGLDDWVFGVPDLSVVPKFAAAGPTLVMAHCPAIFDDLIAQGDQQDGISPYLVISGHTHGGQIAPFGIAPYTPYGSSRYVQGWYHHAQADLYVMRGIGFSNIQLRIGSRPELTIFELT